VIGQYAAANLDSHNSRHHPRRVLISQHTSTPVQHTKGKSTPPERKKEKPKERKKKISVFFIDAVNRKKCRG